MKFSGVTILQGVEFFIFPIDLEWALQQCSATALPVINLIHNNCEIHVNSRITVNLETLMEPETPLE